MPSTTAIVVACIATLATFLIADAIWLKAFVGPFFRERIGHLMRDDPKLEVAAVFYLLFGLGAVYFAVIPALKGGGGDLAIINGALLGFLAYGTFEATNMTIMKDYQWSLVVADTLWGALVTGLSSWAGYLAGNAVS